MNDSYEITDLPGVRVWTYPKFAWMKHKSDSFDFADSDEEAAERILTTLARIPDPAYRREMFVTLCHVCPLPNADLFRIFERCQS